MLPGFPTLVRAPIPSKKVGFTVGANAENTRWGYEKGLYGSLYDQPVAGHVLYQVTDDNTGQTIIMFEGQHASLFSAFKKVVFDPGSTHTLGAWTQNNVSPGGYTYAYASGRYFGPSDVGFAVYFQLLEG
jgi:hypothetical protein